MTSYYARYDMNALNKVLSMKWMFCLDVCLIYFMCVHAIWMTPVILEHILHFSILSEFRGRNSFKRGRM